MAKKRIKSELSLVFGREPEITDVSPDDALYNLELNNLLQWYGQYGGADSPQALKNFHQSWLKEWASANGIKKGSYKLPTAGISTLGALARISLKGFNLKESHVEKLSDAFAQWQQDKRDEKKNEVNSEDKKKIAAIKKKLQDEELLSKFLSTFDTEADGVASGNKEWNITVSEKLTAGNAAYLRDFYQRSLDEYQSALKKKDPAIGFNKTTLKRLVKLHEDILEEIDKAEFLAKATRKASVVSRRKKKPASSQIKKLKYATANADYNLTSIDAEKIVGANTLYLFDADKRILKKCVSPSGILVTGTTVKNCMVVQKKVRKPELLKGFAKLTKDKALKFFNELTTKEAPSTGRTNENTLILSVFQ